jgi:hypothetical protein
MNEELAIHDSETLKHINQVREGLWKLIRELDLRAQNHDKSKLESPEREIFAANAHKLAKTTYGTPEYEALLKEVQPAVEHHYAKNRHHPNHFKDGIEGMDLVDVLEMLVDWIAATQRNKNGNIHKSIELNKERFQMADQVAKILENTVNRYF